MILNSSHSINRKHCFNNSRDTNIANQVLKEPHEYTKVYIPNAYYNREKIANVAKNANGVYKFTTPTGSSYIGSSKNLYDRVCSYFKPSILAKKRVVDKYFSKNGFKNVDLYLYIMDSQVTGQMILELEQYFIYKFTPDLNVILNIL